jgi:hypothetical protein
MRDRQEYQAEYREQEYVRDINAPDQDQVDDDIRRIVRLKEELAAWCKEVRSLVDNGTLRGIKAADMEYAFNNIDELASDLLCKDYDRLTDMYGSLEWPAKVPSFINLHPVPTNPAHHNPGATNNPLVERIARKLAPKITGFEYGILLEEQQADLKAQIQPILAGCEAEAMRAFVESITDASGPYRYLDGTQIVIDARAVLARLDGKDAA